MSEQIEQALVLEEAKAQGVVMNFLNQHLHLLPEKGIYWEEAQMLILADVHLGKVNHFRKAGIAVPGNALFENFRRMDEVVRHYAPRTILFLGDLFHSKANKEWEAFRVWRDTNYGTKMILVQGNHDILPVSFYKEADVELAVEHYIEPPFLFCHEPLPYRHHRFYSIAGHIHPCVRLRGPGKQQVQLPCYLFTDHQALLPAFGAFTGTALLRPAKDDVVYVVADNKVLKVS